MFGNKRHTEYTNIWVKGGDYFAQGSPLSGDINSRGNILTALESAKIYAGEVDGDTATITGYNADGSAIKQGPSRYDNMRRNYEGNPQTPRTFTPDQERALNHAIFIAALHKKYSFEAGELPKREGLRDQYQAIINSPSAHGIDVNNTDTTPHPTTGLTKAEEAKLVLAQYNQELEKTKLQIKEAKKFVENPAGLNIDPGLSKEQKAIIQLRSKYVFAKSLNYLHEDLCKKAGVDCNKNFAPGGTDCELMSKEELAAAEKNGLLANDEKVDINALVAANAAKSLKDFPKTDPTGITVIFTGLGTIHGLGRIKAKYMLAKRKERKAALKEGHRLLAELDGSAPLPPANPVIRISPLNPPGGGNGGPGVVPLLPIRLSPAGSLPPTQGSPANGAPGAVRLSPSTPPPLPGRGSTSSSSSNKNNRRTPGAPGGLPTP